MKINHYNSWIFQLVDVLIPTVDVRTCSWIQPNILIDCEELNRIGKNHKIKYLNLYEVFDGNGVIFHGIMNGLIAYL